MVGMSDIIADVTAKNDELELRCNDKIKVCDVALTLNEYHGLFFFLASQGASRERPLSIMRRLSEYYAHIS
jgi:hypothetical protein